jgi:ubiquinone/menaquinone biosynthesis C-methylase UbiE
LPRRIRTPVSFVTKEVLDLKRKHVKSILDLGCGAGRPTVFLAEKGFDVVGVDISKSALKLASAWARKERLTNVALIHGTMTHLPFRHGCFDAVVSVSVIVHAMKKDIEHAMAEIHRILKKNGLLLINLTSVKDPRYGKGEEVEKDTFKILESFEDKRFEELHHFFTRKEAHEMLSHFAETKVELMNESPFYWKVMANK